MVSRLPHMGQFGRFARLIVISGMLSLMRGGPAPVAIAATARPLAGGPQLHVYASSDVIEAYNWPLGNTIDLTIERAGTPASPDFSASQIVVPAPWDPSKDVAIFDLTGAS